MLLLLPCALCHHPARAWFCHLSCTGQFHEGRYHGEGMFEWPDRLNVYRGQWADGEMHGRGVLAVGGGDLESGGPFVYVGEFRQGQIAKFDESLTKERAM